MSEGLGFKKLLEQIGTSELWTELAKRFDVQFGKIQMAIHNGRPSKFAEIQNRLDIEEKVKRWLK